MPRAGFEPATTRSSASPSNKRLSRVLSQAELPRHATKIEMAFTFLSFRKHLEKATITEPNCPQLFHRTLAPRAMKNSSFLSPHLLLIIRSVFVLYGTIFYSRITQKNSFDGKNMLFIRNHMQTSGYGVANMPQIVNCLE